jgi:hypothetical protein
MMNVVDIPNSTYRWVYYAPLKLLKIISKSFRSSDLIFPYHHVNFRAFFNMLYLIVAYVNAFAFREMRWSGLVLKWLWLSFLQIRKQHILFV